jgi:hypothetical protein
MSPTAVLNLHIKSYSPSFNIILAYTKDNTTVGGITHLFNTAVWDIVIHVRITLQ